MACSLSEAVHHPPNMRRILASAFLLVLPSCNPDKIFDKPVQPFDESDELVVLVRNSPATRFLGADGKYSGIEQDLLDLFSKDTGTRIRVIERSKFGEILPALRHHLAHLAAAGLTATKERRKEFIFGPAYLSVQTVVAYNTDRQRPRNVRDLVGKRVVVLAGSSGAEQLRTGSPGRNPSCNGKRSRRRTALNCSTNWPTTRSTTS